MSLFDGGDSDSGSGPGCRRRSAAAGADDKDGRRSVQRRRPPRAGVRQLRTEERPAFSVCSGINVGAGGGLYDGCDVRIFRPCAGGVYALGARNHSSGTGARQGHRGEMWRPSRLGRASRTRRCLNTELPKCVTGLTGILHREIWIDPECTLEVIDSGFGLS